MVPNKLKIVVFDFDGTLVRQNSSWSTLHKYFGTERAARSNLRAYENGLTDYEEFMRRDIQLWPRVTLAAISRILQARTKLRKEAKEVVGFLHNRGYETAVISAGIDIIVRKLAEEAGVHRLIANGLQTDKHGYLTGKGILRVDLLRKDVALKTLLASMGFSLGETAAVGDSKFDLSMMESAGLSFAIDGDDEAMRCADVVVSRLTEILNYL